MKAAFHANSLPSPQILVHRKSASVVAVLHVPARVIFVLQEYVNVEASLYAPVPPIPVIQVRVSVELTIRVPQDLLVAWEFVSVVVLLVTQRQMYV